MIIRCRQCWIQAEPHNGLCPVCRIGQTKLGNDLTRIERWVRLHVRAVRCVALMHMAFAMALLVWLLPQSKTPSLMIFLVLINGLIAWKLSVYSLFGYRMVVAYHFITGMVNIVSIQRGAEHFLGIILSLFTLYLVGNATARGFFERALPDSE